MRTDDQRAEFESLLSELSYDELVTVEQYMRALAAGDEVTVARMDREIEARRKVGCK